MIAAIYARKSTEQNGVGDEEKSVTRQIEHAKEYAAKKGWTIAEDCIYVDDGISGAEFVKRPAFLRLMNALKPKPPFQVLIMSEESRLGREQIETAYALKQIMDAGVRVFFYLEDRERTLDNALDKVMLSLTRRRRASAPTTRSSGRRSRYTCRVVRSMDTITSRCRPQRLGPTADPSASTWSGASMPSRRQWSSVSSSCTHPAWASRASPSV